jgi:predicted nuclease with TOPRIM domain
MAPECQESLKHLQEENARLLKELAETKRQLSNVSTRCAPAPPHEPSANASLLEENNSSLKELLKNETNAEPVMDP